MTADAPLVRCEHLARDFGAGTAVVRAVRDVTCDIAPGQHIALVGASGSGKSTLLHLFAGLDRPTAGSISWPALEGAPLRPGPVAVVFQAPSLLAPLDVLENVALPLVLLGIRAVEARAGALAAIERLGLGELGAKLPEELSGGQAQRVAVARALVAVPSLILADEPTGQLDSVTAAEVTAALLEAADATGAALVIATHDRTIARRLDHRWTIIDGQLAMDADQSDEGGGSWSR